MADINVGYVYKILISRQPSLFDVHHACGIHFGLNTLLFQLRILYGRDLSRPHLRLRLRIRIHTLLALVSLKAC